MIGSPTTSFIVALAAFVAAVPCLAGSIVVDGPAGEPVPQVEILRWSDGEGGRPIGRFAAPGRADLTAGSYAVRLAGTDHRLGPLAVSDAGVTSIHLGRIAITAPPGAAPVPYFLLDPTTGAAAARLLPGAPAVSVVPGRYQLIRDLAIVQTTVNVEPSQTVGLAAGLLELRASLPVSDFGYHVLGESDSIAAFAHFSDGPQALLPGKYRLVAQGDARQIAVEVVAGDTTPIRGSALRVLALGDESSRPFGVVTAEGLRPVLRAKTDATPYFLLAEGDELIALGAGGQAGLSFSDRVKTAGARFLALAGHVTTFWMQPDGALASADGSGEIPVKLEATARGYVPVGRPVGMSVVVAEPVDVQVRLVTPNASSSRAIGQLHFDPPGGRANVTLPIDLVDRAVFSVELSVQLASGTNLTGRSPPYLAAHPITADVGSISARAVSPTVVELSWNAVSDPRVVGYNLYRSPQGAHPVAPSLRDLRFRDIGLSAATDLQYRVCAVDAREIEGPCQVARARTPNFE